MIINNVNHIKILAEFDNAIIKYNKQSIDNNMQYDADGKQLSQTCDLTIEFEENTDMILVQQIIDSHDPTPLPTISDDEVLSAKIETKTINLLIDLGVI